MKYLTNMHPKYLRANDSPFMSKHLRQMLTSKTIQVKTGKDI